MGDHFVLLVDRLLTESTLAATIGRGDPNQSGIGKHCDLQKEVEVSAHQGHRFDRFENGKIVECRICHEEDVDFNMESPCSCCGSLKYAHRKCIQRWCNEKGDILCEICLQQFGPGYTAPPKLFHYGSAPMNFRGSWEVSRSPRNNSHFLRMVSTNDHNNTDDGDDDDDYQASRNMLYCRSVGIIFTVLLILRHILPIIVSGDEYTFTLFVLSAFRILGILVPVYVMVRALSTLHRRRRQHVAWHSSP